MTNLSESILTPSNLSESILDSYRLHATPTRPRRTPDATRSAMARASEAARRDARKTKEAGRA